jgi:hypothetical protein
MVLRVPQEETEDTSDEGDEDHSVDDTIEMKPN